MRCGAPRRWGRSARWQMETMRRPVSAGLHDCRQRGAKYNSWSAYTSVLREDHFVASKGDLEVLKRVAKDESVPRLDRSRAHMTRGYVLYSLGDREGAARSYRQAMVLCKAATAEERTRNVLLPDERAMKLLPTPSGPIFDDTLKTASENLASIELPAQMDTQSIAESMATRFQENLEIGQEPQQAFDQAFADGMSALPRHRHLLMRIPLTPVF